LCVSCLLIHLNFIFRGEDEYCSQYYNCSSIFMEDVENCLVFYDVSIKGCHFPCETELCLSKHEYRALCKLWHCSKKSGHGIDIVGMSLGLGMLISGLILVACAFLAWMKRRQQQQRLRSSYVSLSDVSRDQQASKHGYKDKTIFL
jgi:hypothetical protein